MVTFRTGRRGRRGGADADQRPLSLEHRTPGEVSAGHRKGRRGDAGGGTPEWPLDRGLIARPGGGPQVFRGAPVARRAWGPPPPPEPIPRPSPALMPARPR